MDQATFERASQILDAIIDAPRHQRGDLLIQHCGGDDRLRDHLNSLLDAIDADEFLESPVVSLSHEAADSPRFMLTHVGPYELVRLIGEGGMGTVYEARQENPRRLVAVKILRAGMFSIDAARRFARESQVLGLLHHPGIAQVFEAGTAMTPVGEVPYFAMELVRGLPLGAFRDARRLGIRAVLELLAHICDAVDHAHRQSVVHRDLKPANILIESPDTEGGADASAGERDAIEGQLDRARPKILDFGVARAAQSLLPDGVTLHTDAGQIIGTLSYMSPEQVSGDPTRVDARSDVYSLGVIAYEMLAHRLPIDVKGRAIPEVTQSILHDEPTRLRTLDSRLAGDIDTIIAKAIEKDPVRRYQSAAALAADIRRYLRDEPIVARPATSLYQLRKFARRNRVLVAGVAATLLTLVAGTATTSYWALRASERRSLAESRADQLQREAYRASIAAAQSSLDRGQATAAREYLARAPEPLRGWEWRYLHQLVDRSDRTIDIESLGYTSAALAGEFAFMHRDEEAMLLNWKTGERKACTPSVGISTPYAMSVSPRGDSFVVCGEKATALWDVATGTVIKPFDLEPRFEGMCFTPDGSMLAMGLVNPCRIDFYNAGNGETTRTIAVQGVERLFPSISPDGSRMLAEAKGGVTSMFRLPQGDVSWEFPGVQPRFSSDGRSVLLYSGLRQKAPRLHVLDADSGRERHSMLLEDNIVSANGSSSGIVSVSPDGSMLAHLTMSGGIRLLSAGDLSSLGVLSGLGPRDGSIYNGVVFSTDGRWLAAHSAAHEIKVWDIRRSAVWAQASTRDDLHSNAGAISPDESFSVTSNWGQIVAWDLTTGAPRWAAHPSFEFFISLTMNTSSDRIFAGGDRGTVLILDARTGDVLHSAAPHGVMSFGSYATRSMSFGMDPPRLLAGFHDGTVMHLDPRTLASRRQQSLGGGPVVALRASPGGGRFACILGGTRARVLVFAGESDVPELDLELPGAVSLAWSHDDSLLAIGYEGGVRIIEPSGRVHTEIRGMRGVQMSLAFTPDASRLVAGTIDGSLGVWFVGSGDLALELPLPRQESALSVLVRADERAIQVVTNGGATVAFETEKPDESVALAREIARRGRGLYRQCKARGVFLPETLALIDGAAGVDRAAREEAIRQARMLCEHPATFNNHAYSETVNPPDEATLRLALRHSEAAIARCSDSFGLLTRGRVLYRAGRFAEALDFLSRGRAGLGAIRPNWGEGPPEVSAFLGLCEAELGHVAEARAWFAIFDRVVEEPRYKGSDEAIRFTRMVTEARETLLRR